LNRLYIFTIGDKNMKYSIFAAALIALFLAGCGGEGKPGQYPPSLYEDEKGERLGAPPGGNPDR
jgi:hypothetical protein